MNTHEDLIVAVVCFSLTAACILVGICLYMMIRRYMPLWMTAGRPAFEILFDFRLPTQPPTRRETVTFALMMVALVIGNIVIALYSEDSVQRGALRLFSWLWISC